MDTDIKISDAEYLTEVDESFNKLCYSVLHIMPDNVPISVLRTFYNQGRIDEAASLLTNFELNGQTH